MTLKAVKRIRQCQVIAIPHEKKENCVAYNIARAAVPEIENQEILCLPMPMTMDRKKLQDSHEKAAQLLVSCLEKRQTVGFLSLGDVTIYSTFAYVMEKVAERGFKISMECGVPSFCACAAKLLTPLSIGSGQLHIISASHQIEDTIDLPGTKVYMKAGRQMGRLKELLIQRGRQALMVENCGMENEKVYLSLEEIPEQPGYYSLVIVP